MMSSAQGSLLGLFQSKRRTSFARQKSLEEARNDLGLKEEQELSPICVAYALMKLRVQPEEVSRLLTWREFEGLAGALFRAAGFQVKENLYLTKPRAQIDLVAYGTSIALCVDCKHYSRGEGRSSLATFAKAQLIRSSLLRAKTSDPRPIATVILSMSEPEGRFVEGVAVVPIRTLRSFLTNLDSYLGMLDLR